MCWMMQNLCLSALAFEPDNKLVRFDYMNVLYKRQRFELSMAQAQVLLDAEPDNHKYRFAYANQCVAVGRFEEALGYYDEFIASDPMQRLCTYFEGMR